MSQQRNSRQTLIASVSPVIGAGLTIAGWVVVANVTWQLAAGLTQALLCETRSRRPLECLPAWSQMGEIGRRSTDTLLALVVHSPAESVAAAMGGMAGTMLLSLRRKDQILELQAKGWSQSQIANHLGITRYQVRKAQESKQPLSGPIGIVPPPSDLHGGSTDDPDDPDDPEPA